MNQRLQSLIGQNILKKKGNGKNFLALQLYSYVMLVESYINRIEKFKPQKKIIIFVSEI